MTYKLMFGLFACVLLVSYVTSSFIMQRWSFDETFISKQPTEKPTENLMTQEEYSQIFSDYRNGLISQEKAKNKLRNFKIIK